MSLIVQGISKKFGPQIAVEPFSFTIEKGSIVGFLGPNGAGKSTSLKMIAGILAPDQGSIQINGIDIAKNPHEAKKLIGYLPESNPLYEDMYMKEYFQFLGAVHQIPQLKNKIESIIDQLSLGPMQNKKIGALSKGYKQRVGIAGAILHEPALLLLDEPTAGLDPNQLIEIRTRLKEWSSNTMILFSTHILQEVAAVCSKVLVLHHGKLVADEPIEQFMQPRSNHLHIDFEQDISHCLNHIQALGITVISINKHQLVIKTEEAKDVKKIMMQFALDMDLNIERLHVAEASLEEIFNLLTH